MAQTHIRMKHPPEALVPRFATRLVVALIVAVLALVTVVSLTDRPDARVAPVVIAQRVITIDTQTDGSVHVTDEAGALIKAYAPSEAGFVAVIARVLHRERMRAGVPQAAPVTIEMRQGNRLALSDPSTGWSAELVGFGPDNVRMFANFLTPQQ